MKKSLFLVLGVLLSSGIHLRAEDAATEERLNQLNGRIEDLINSQETQRKRIAELSKEIDSLREQSSKPTGNYASTDDLKKLAEAIKEVDRKRLEDYDKIHAELVKLGKTLTSPSGSKKGSDATAPAHSTGDKSGDKSGEKSGDKGGAADKGVYEYVVQSGDTLDAIVQAYKEKNIKVTVAQILKANPGLEPTKMKVGQKLVIPAP